MDEDDFSDSEANVSIIDSTCGPNISFKGKLPEDRLQYKKDKKCVFCGDVFGLGILHAKKHYCKFCYRGICAKCSPKVAYHPEDKKNLRICNFCCENSVKASFSESFNIKTADIQDQILQVRRESARVHTDVQMILKESYKYESLIRLEESKWQEVLEKHRDLPDLTKDKSLKFAKLQSMLQQFKEVKSKLDEQESKISKLILAFQIEKKNSVSSKQNLAEIKNRLSELQDYRIHLHKTGIKRSKNVVLSESEKKEESEFNLQVIKNFEIESENLQLSKEIEKLSSENEDLNKRLKVLKEEFSPDRIVSSDRGKYDIEEEEKVRSLRNKQKVQQATIEKLKLELRLGVDKTRKDQELRGSEEDEEVVLNQTTRPCARCQIY